ncbi:hypothetical protein LINPERHAP2_LOCUS27064, partial [Linum perenne]
NSAAPKFSAEFDFESSSPAAKAKLRYQTSTASMETSTSVLLSSQSSSLGNLRLGSNCAAGNRNFSLGHFNKHLEGRTSSSSFRLSARPIGYPLLRSSFSVNQKVPLLKITRTRHFISPLKCSYFSGSTTSLDSFKLQPLLERVKESSSSSFENSKRAVLEASPLQIAKWFVLLAIPISAVKWTADMLVSPFFWSLVHMSLVFWPWMLAISLALYGIYCSYRVSKGKANVFEQFAVVTSLITWLTVVPPAHVNGFLEGWPVVFFFVYHYFFFLNVSVRKRLYGDCYERPHDSKWDVNPPISSRILFIVGALIGHFFAASEGLEIHLIPGGWNSVLIWILIVAAILLQYNTTSYLAKYSNKVVVPSTVVRVGPYRWVRHPMYSSTILLFASYFAALRAPLSFLFVVAVSVMFYDKKAKMEEALMIESFGDGYVEYMNRVQYKLIPFVF